MNLKTVLGQLRILAIIEGISYILFAFTMPLKYKYEIGTPNKIIGMIHGFLFIAYCIWVVRIAFQKKWTTRITFLCLVASLVPFATFVVDSKLLKKEN